MYPSGRGAEYDGGTNEDVFDTSRSSWTNDCNRGHHSDGSSGRTNISLRRINLLRDVEGIGIAQLSRDDVVRHSLVQKIVEAGEQVTPEGRSKKDDAGA